MFRVCHALYWLCLEFVVSSVCQWGHLLDELQGFSNITKPLPIWTMKYTFFDLTLLPLHQTFFPYIIKLIHCTMDKAKRIRLSPLIVNKYDKYLHQDTLIHKYKGFNHRETSRDARCPIRIYCVYGESVCLFMFVVVLFLPPT